jgi:Ca2+-binding RTX toxin-like protein
VTIVFSEPVTGETETDMLDAVFILVEVFGSDADNLIDASALTVAGAFIDGDDTLIGTEQRDLLRGSFGADLIEGRGERDTILGGSKNDTLRGGDGFDQLFGERGDDVLDGGDGDD